MSTSGFTEEYEYDCQNRNKKTNQIFNTVRYGKQIGYQKTGDHATNRINSIAYLKNEVTDGKINYTYDSMGNIISISENGKKKTKYEYDLLGRLTKEISLDINREIIYTYDNNGNVLTKTVNGETIEYKYKENSDRLVAFGNETFVYDLIGNPTTYRDMTVVWENGRQLKSLNDGTNTIEYTYYGTGLRKSKKVGNETITYMYDNSGKLIKEEGENTLEYVYGQDGIIGIIKDNVPYLFRKNIFGDITHIYNENGDIVGKYSYTAFGECTVELDVNNIAMLNPIRYRGYYFDEETSLYYLRSRYYDPEIGRFISIDGIKYLNPNIINGLNLYAYCVNNPVMNVDPNGNAWWNPFSWDWSQVGTLLKSIQVIVKGIENITATAVNMIIPSEKITVQQESFTVQSKKDVSQDVALMNLVAGTGVATTPIIAQGGQSIGGGPYIDPNPIGWGKDGKLSTYQRVMGGIASIAMVAGLVGAIVSFFCPPIGFLLFGIGYAVGIFSLAISGLGGAT